MRVFFLAACLVAVVQAYFAAGPRIRHASTQPLSMMFNFGGGSKSTKAAIPKNAKICVITGTTSGLGKETARALINTGEYYVICACRDVERMKQVAAAEGFDSSLHTILPLDLGSFDSTKAFVKKLGSIKSRPLDALVCNAAVYQPALLQVCALLHTLFIHIIHTHHAHTHTHTPHTHTHIHTLTLPPPPLSQ